MAHRYGGVARQTVHAWLRRYAAGPGGLADQSSRLATCLHQMPAQVEALIGQLRRTHPGWGPRMIGIRYGQIPLWDVATGRMVES